MDITASLPTSDSVLQLEPEELAPYLLEHLRNRENNLHLTHVFDISGLHDHYKDDRVEPALIEAWAWLVREGLIVQKNSEGWFFVSRRGKRLLDRPTDFAAYQRSNILPKASLHPVIAERVWSNFIRGEYDTAVFQAFKEVEVAVRTAGGFGPTDFGTVLMGKAFNIEIGPLADMSLPEAERRAMLNLFFGAVGLFKNPGSHRHIALSDPAEAAEMISFASLLMRTVEGRAATRAAGASKP